MPEGTPHVESGAAVTMIAGCCGADGGGDWQAQDMGFKKLAVNAE